jgi:cytochrome c-type biogenesis protein
MLIGNVSLLLAFAAGTLSFAAPCVLPLVPAYLGYLSGQVVKREDSTVSRWTTLSHGLSFVLGFSAIFVGLGAAASGIGRLLYNYRPILMKSGGAVIVVFGLHTLGVVKIPWLYYDTRRQYRPRQELGYVSSALMGVFFGAGWSPCVGATLGAILTLALNEATVLRGALLLFTYSMGLGIPFLMMAFGIGEASGFLRRRGRMMNLVSVVSGLFLIILGVLVFTNSLGWLAQWGPLIELGVP